MPICLDPNIDTKRAAMNRILCVNDRDTSIGLEVQLAQHPLTHALVSERWNIVLSHDVISSCDFANKATHALNSK